MAHVKSFSEGGPEGEYLYTIQDEKKILLGGPYPSIEHADAMSKAVSKAVGHGSVADYKSWLKQNDSLFRPDTRMRGIENKPRTMRLLGHDDLTHYSKPWGFLGIPYEEWREHEIKSMGMNVPWDADSGVRRRVQREKTQDLIDRMGGELTPWQKTRLMLGGAVHQGFQGAGNIKQQGLLEMLTSWPNAVDYGANLSTIWDAPANNVFSRKKKKP